jgi:hypothetical protein
VRPETILIVCRQGKKRDLLYTQAVNEYEEQTIQATRKISNNYIDSQRDHQFTISIGNSDRGNFRTFDKYMQIWLVTLRTI